PNYDMTAQLGRDIETLMANNGKLKTDEDIKGYADLNPGIRTKLLEWGIVDSRTTSNHISTPLSDHLKDFIESRRAENRKGRYIKQIQSYIKDVLDGCKLRIWSEIDGTAVMLYLAKGRGNDTEDVIDKSKYLHKGKLRTKYGQGTYNTKVRAFKSFVIWLEKARKLTPNPMDDIQEIHQTVERKKRRAMTDEQKRRLLQITKAEPKRFNLTGHERYLVYRLTSEIGARYSEVKGVQVLSFNLRSTQPSLEIPAHLQKNKKASQHCLGIGLASELRDYFSDKAPTDRAFKGLPHSTDAAKMLRADLAAAGIEYRDAAGRDIDFHSLRHTFITDLFLAGVAATVVQKLARHKDLKTTMCYSHVRREDTVNAIQRLGEQTASDITMFRPISDQNHTQIRTDMESSGKETAMKIPKRAVSA
ncbi:hypothetical protein LCGC14_2550190, partial [marine sediment metagenome]